MFTDFAFSATISLACFLVATNKILRPELAIFCKAFVPWSEGLTFTQVTWQRACDTNNDNKYGCGDEGYDASDDGAACPAG